MEKIKYYNETKLNQDELVSLLSEQTLPAKKMIISISSIVILFIILLLNWDKENPSMYILLTVLLAIGLIGLILLLIGKKWLIKVSNKNLANGVLYQYTFYENEFSVDTIVGGKKDHMAMKYSGLEKIVIKDNIAYLYINSVSIFFVDLDDFAGEKEEVIKIFSQYKRKKSKR